MLAEAIIKNGIEIVVVTDHNTTKGIKKLQMAVSIIMKIIRFMIYILIFYME